MPRQNSAPRLQAALDLARRYGAAFVHAWRERKRLDPPSRLPFEAQFLPAALELQETPAPAAPRVAAGLIIAFALIALLWAVFGRIDVVATARGRIVPSDRTKIIQPFETATVKAIRVSEGQSVAAGAVLLELDATQAAADTARLSHDLAGARLQSGRAQALLAAIESGRTPVLGAPTGVSPERLAGEQRLLEGEYAEFRTKLARIDAEVVRREADLASAGEIVHKLEQTVPIAVQRARDFKELVEKQFISKHGYLEKEQVSIEQQADLATQRARLTELAAALEEGRRQRAALIAEARRQTLDSLNEAQQKAATYAQELLKAQARGRLMTLTAPVAGTVQQLAVHTVGGVVTPAQPLMAIVPDDHPLEVEAFLENKDIGFVDAGQEAEIKVETFPFTRYGTIPARVIHVSHDAISDEKRGLIYAVRAGLGRTAMQVEDKLVDLSAGMAVTVEVKTGRRRVIEYFLSPLMQYGQESLRER